MQTDDFCCGGGYDLHCKSLYFKFISEKLNDFAL